ncbi:UvrD-helicase domain-containing protein [Haloflavibacter putidus]|uniref:DNA 3'-5' helicase n=1 Tax=Haloflavibacter putidus TaxID=2576776 RepID=A0A507ZVD7_9FLAO|nr:UvrD-helicase domain-containing protein [Haloflavibacter putidus]TQD40581.1 AAA family ATPase [Haloflavibacter putidus]
MQQNSPFKIYDASAGSGKTFTLVSRYLSILLSEKRLDAYQNILAITFMNKAVAEMKSRIIDSLRAFAETNSAEKTSPLFKQVQSQTNLSAEEIQQKSKKILEQILHNYAGFEVSTIDGFTHRLLRTFAKDLDIPTNFEVEMDQETILTEAVDRIIAKAGKNKIITRALINFVIEKTDDDKSWDVSKDLFSISKLLINENNLPALLKLSGKSLTDFENFKKELNTKLAENEKALSHLAEGFFALLNQKGLENSNFNRSSIPNYFSKILAKELPALSKNKPKWQENIATHPHYKGAEKEVIKATMDAIQAEIVSLFEKTESLVIENSFLRDIAKDTSSLSLLAAIQEELEVLKKEYNAVLISEFNQTISKNIQGQPTPFIYERLGERYKHFFIDEFQDTSILQWQNLIPLVGHQLEMLEGSLMLVGDVKQSIYRWRGGRAEQFLRLSNQTDKNFSVLQEKISLQYNFRSAPQIIEFNNAFFTHAAQFLSKQEYQELFKNATQEIGKTNQAEQGYVNLRFLEANNVEEKNEVFPQEVYQIIQDLEEKNFAKKDICILVRNKKEGIAIANYLSQKDVPIISSETLLLNNAPEVRFIDTLLQLSLQPDDKNLRFEVLDFLFSQQTDKGLNHFQFQNNKLNLPLPDFFKSLESIGINFAIENFYNLPLYDAVEYSLRSFGLANTSNAYLQFFLDTIYTYTQKHKDGIQGFVNFWGNKKDSLSISAPETIDAVQILTIHKSKGLEFPIVIYPYADEKINDTSKEKIWIDLPQNFSIPTAQIRASQKLQHYKPVVSEAYQEVLEQTELDNLNLLYVTLTRAKQQLYVLSTLDLSKNKIEKTEKFSGIFINFLKKQNAWQEDKSNYEFGKIPGANLQKQKIQTLSEDNLLNSSSPSAHNLEIVTKSGALWESHAEKAIAEGNLIHELLKTVSYQEDVEKAVKNAIQTGLLLKTEAEQYLDLLQKVSLHPQLKQYFKKDYQVFTEKEILNQKKFKRLDRLCIKAKLATIIDYKTGSYSGTHTKQVNQYAKAIEEMGYIVEKKLLVYINEDVTVKNV